MPDTQQSFWGADENIDYIEAAYICGVKVVPTQCEKRGLFGFTLLELSAIVNMFSLNTSATIELLELIKPKNIFFSPLVLVNRVSLKREKMYSLLLSLRYFP